MRIENLFWIGFVGGGLALLFAFLQLGRLLPLPVGGQSAQDLTTALRKGTHAYLKWQLPLSLGGLLLVFGILEALAYGGFWDFFSPPALLSGGLCALLTGAVSAGLTAAAGPRAADAAGDRLDRGVDASLSAGTVSGFLAVGLVLLHLTVWFFLLRYQFACDAEAIVRTLLFLGLGSALTCLLLRMGSVFAQGAALAAQASDREMGLPPDDPKNPAAIADRIGHGVGTAAGMGAELYCACELLLPAALYLGRSVFAPADMTWNAMLLPLAVAVIGVVASLIGLLTVRPKERGDRYSLPWCLRLAALVPALLTAAAALPITYLLTGNFGLCLPILAGVAMSVLVPLCGEYFTSDTYRPARSLADTAETGSPAAITAAMGTGLCAAVLPLLLAAAALAAAFWTAGGWFHFYQGVYGMALAGAALLSVSLIPLSAALCGPVGDCAAHAASLTDAEEAPRRRTDSLAAIGASAANGGRCLSAVSALWAGLTLFLLMTRDGGLPLNAPLILGGLLGCAAVVLFLGFFLLAIRRAANATLLRARKQFQDNEALMDGSEAPDYAACVSRCAVRSLLGSILPALSAVLVPTVLALPLGLFSPAGHAALVGYAGAVLALSVPLSLFFTLSGGVLSGTRRYVDSGRKGGRGSECHRSVLAAERSLAPLSLAAGPVLLALVRLTLALALFLAALINTLPASL